MESVEDELQYDDYDDYEELMIEKFLTVEIEEDNADDNSEQEENENDETYVSEPGPSRASNRKKDTTTAYRGLGLMGKPHKKTTLTLPHSGAEMSESSNYYKFAKKWSDFAN